MLGDGGKPESLLSGRWRLERRLGRGAMGEVFRAQDLVLGRKVAVKRLAPDLLDDTAMLARFRREAMASSRLVHPNVVTTLDFGVDHGAPYIVMELVPGTSLEQLLYGQGPFDPVRVARLGRDIALGLEAAHRQGIVHRDIKPANVMVTDTSAGEAARILDFGIAQAPSVGPGLTMGGVGVGTPGYVAPEQIAGDTVGPAADLFSLGVTLFELLVDDLPWEAEDAMGMISATLTKDPRTPSSLRLGPGIPEALEQLILAMLRKTPSERPADAATVVRELQAFLDDDRIRSGRESSGALAQRGASEPLAAASLSRDRSVAMQQLAWFSRSVEDEGGTVAQTVGNEVVARLPSAESALRLTRTHPPTDVPRPALALHVGDVVVDESEIALGGGIRAVLRLARLAGPEETLLTAELHDAIGMGWRGRLEPRGRVRLETDHGYTVYALQGSGAAPEERGCIESHPDGPHWRCPCRAHGPLPKTEGSKVRVRCSMCSRLLVVDVRGETVPALPAPTTFPDHPLSSVVLSSTVAPENPTSREDAALISALAGFGS